jgi:hypothetical protein
MKLFSLAFKKRLSIYINSSRVKFTKQELINIGMEDHPLWFAHFDSCLRLGFECAIKSCDENNVVIYRLPTNTKGSGVPGSSINKVFKTNMIAFLKKMIEHEEFIVAVHELYKFGLGRVSEKSSELCILTLCFESPKFVFSIVGYDENGYILRRKAVPEPTWTPPSGLTGTVNGFKF